MSQPIRIPDRQQMHRRQPILDQAVVFDQPGDDLFQAEIFDDFAHIAAEPIDVVPEIGLDIVGVLGQALEVMQRGFVKLQAASAVQEHLYQVGGTSLNLA